MIRRLVLPEGHLGGAEIRVSGASLHYLSRVLRLAAGEEVELVDGTGRRCLGRLERITREEGTVLVVEELPREQAPERELRLVYGLSRGRRTEWVLQKATELGVDAVSLALCERSVRRPDRGADKLGRWQEIIAQAGRQCGRARFPPPQPVRALDEALEPVPGGGIGLLAHMGGAPLEQVAPEAQASRRHLVVAVGPEGGFTQGEADLARDRGYQLVGLGPYTLRTETAAVTLLGLAAFLMGRMAAAG